MNYRQARVTKRTFEQEYVDKYSFVEKVEDPIEISEGVYQSTVHCTSREKARPVPDVYQGLRIKIFIPNEWSRSFV